MSKLDIKPSTYYCHDCEEELTEDNTSGYGGFDGSNYLSSKAFGQSDDPSYFIKCDSCFDGDVDRYLDNLYG